MQRLKRRNRPYQELKTKSSGGMLDLFDNTIKETFFIDDNEYDYICENATQEELDILLNDPDSISILTKQNLPKLSFTDRRNMINVLDNLLTRYEKQNEFN